MVATPVNYFTLHSDVHQTTGEVNPRTLQVLSTDQTGGLTRSLDLPISMQAAKPEGKGRYRLGIPCVTGGPVKNRITPVLGQGGLLGTHYKYISVDVAAFATGTSERQR